VTSDLLIDSCVLTKLVIVEPDSHVADQLIATNLQAGNVVVALDLALIEVGNAIWKAWHRGLIQAADATTALEKVLMSPFTFIEVRPLLDRALELAMTYRIAVYDALFVAASESLGCQSFTSDKPLVHKVQADFPQIQALS